MNLTLEQATAYRDHVIAREDALLGDLARLMAATDGPVDLMDASFESLTPLWDWFLRFAEAGFPGVPLQRSSMVRAFSDVIPADLAPGMPYYAIEPLEHYVFRVAQRINSSARWEVWTREKKSRVQDTTQHRTVIRSGPVAFAYIDVPLQTLMSWVLRRDPRGLKPNALFKIVEANSLLSNRRPQDRRESVLTQYLSESPVPMDHPNRQPPRFAQPPSEADEAPSIHQPNVGEELIFAAVGADIERLESATPIDEVAVAAMLATHGFHNDNGSPITAADLRISEQQFVPTDGYVSIQTFAAGNRLRALLLEPIAATENEWTTITDAFTVLSLEIDAKLAPEDEF